MSTVKSPARIAVENAVRKATAPVCAVEISLITGLHPDTVRSHLNNMRYLGLARNTRPGKQTATYLWNHHVIAVQPVNEPRSCMTFDVYTGAELTKPPARQGGMIAYRIPSKGDEVRKPPRSLSSSASTNLNARPL